MNNNYTYCIVGGGIVGLATAYQILLKKPNSQLLVIEKESTVASHQTGHNSGVIHAGIYYKPGSLKALNCRRGYELLIDFCNKNDIPYTLCGKLIVATEEKELPILKNLYDRGLQNGLEGIKMLPKEVLKDYEPHVAGLQGIHVPHTGIINYRAVAEKLAQKIVEMGGTIRLGEKVESLSTNAKDTTITTSNATYTSQLLITCGGLYSDKLAQATQHKKLTFKIIPFRGEYYKLKDEKRYLVKNLIYPVPDPSFPFLGVHFTRMIDNNVEAGPNAVLAFRREGYRKSSFHLGEFAETLLWPGFQKLAIKYWKTGFGEMYRSFFKGAFTRALQKLIPEVAKEDLIPGGAGVRAQACEKNGMLIDDFKIIEEKCAIHVCNAPSPAATSSLAIGETIAKLILKR